MAQKIGGRFYRNADTMMLYDAEKKIAPFAEERIDEVVYKIFKQALNGLAKICSKHTTMREEL